MSPLRARLIPLGLLAAGAAGWFATRRLEVWTDDGPGPGLMPKVALGLMAALALAGTIAPGDAADGDEPAERGVSRTFVLYALSCIAMAATAPFLGFVLPGVVCVFVILRWAEDRSWGASVAYSVALIGTLVLVFGTALNVQFPDGPAERILKTVRVL